MSTTTQTAPFCVGFALRKGDIPGGTGAVVSGADAQVTVKNRWSDGSAKFAVIAGSALLTAGIPTVVSLAAGAAGSGRILTASDLQAAMSDAVTVGCEPFGTATWSGVDWTNPFESWILGHRMSSWIYRKPVGSDPHLVAWLEVRLWDSGSVEVLPWVENGHLLVAGPTNKSGTYTFTMGGTRRFSAAIDLPHHCRTPLVSGGAPSHWLQGPQEVTVKHDNSYLQSTGLVPAYLAKTDPAAVAVTGLPSSFTPLQAGSWPEGSLGGVGYQAYIGLLPEWDAIHLTSDAPATFKALLFNAYSAGRYPFHYRDEGDGYRAPRLSRRAMLNIREPSFGWETTPATSGTVPPFWSLTHQPSVGYLAYLVTGRRYFLDELQFAASTSVLFYSSTTREGASGYFKSGAAGGARLVAWVWRTLAQAAAITPDTDAGLKADYLTQLSNNIDYYHSRYIARPHNPQGWITPAVDYNGPYVINARAAAGATTTVIPFDSGSLMRDITEDGQFVGWRLSFGAETRVVTSYTKASNTITVSSPFSVAPAAGQLGAINDGVYFEAAWMQDFVTAVWGYSKDLGLELSAAAAAKLDALFTWKAQSIVGRLGTAAGTDYLYRDYAPYTIAAAPADNPDWDGGSGPWYSDWGQVYAATYGGKTADGRSCPGYAPPGPRTEGSLRNYLAPTHSAAEALPAIAYAVKHGVTGAAAGYQRLTSAANWPEFAKLLDAEPVWAVAPEVVRR